MLVLRNIIEHMFIFQKSKMKKMWHLILPIILILYLLFFFDLTLKFTNKKSGKITTFDYTGLFWVILDNQLRRKYPLPEEMDTSVPLKFITIKEE